MPAKPRSLEIGCLVATLLLGATPPAHAGGPDALDGYSRFSWTTREGLPAADIRSISQDRTGYVWIGTSAGVVRFDGVRFVHWDALGGPPLPSASVSVLCASRDGSLWVGFLGIPGLSHIRDGHVTTYRQEDGLASSITTALVEDHDGVIWAGGAHGLSRFENGRWERIGRDQGLDELSLDTMYEARGSELWLGTSSGVFRRATGSDTFERVSTIPDFRAFTEDATGRLWATGRLMLIGSPDRRTSMSRPGGIWQRALGWRVLADPAGDLWIATLGQGLIRVSGRERRIIKHYTGPGGLTSDVVFSLFRDREGNIWAGTEGGLERFTETVVMPIDASTAGITGLITSLTAGRDGSVWMGASDGLHHLSANGWRRYAEREGLPSVMVEALHQDHRGTLWAATDRGIAQFVAGRFAAVRGAESPRRVFAITTDHRGTAWLADRNDGLFRWRNGKLAPITPALDNQPTPPLSAYTDRDGRVWAGFADGTLIVDHDGRLDTYSDREALTGGITAIYQDRSGTVWIGTFNGLRRFDAGRFLPVQTTDPVLAGRVGAIIDDNEGYLWIGVRAGIVRVDPAQFNANDSARRIRYTLYDASDGLNGEVVVASPGAVRTPDGKLWFATRHGLAVVDPRRLNTHRLPPPVTIESVTADGRSPDPAQMRLPPLTSNLRIDYTALSFAAPERVRFRYRLEGFDTDWVNAGSRRQAFYTNLPPRRYRFELKAANDGVWNDAGTALEFSILPTFYQTTSFYAASGFVLALAAWGAWRVRVRQERRRFSMVLAERARIAREIHDTLLQSLVGVAVQFKTLAIELESSPERASGHLTTLRRQIEMYIREARRSIWDLRSPTLEQLGLPSALRQAAERMVDGTPVRLAYQVVGAERPCPPRVEEQLLRVGQEAISNVVRHAGATSVTVTLLYRDTDVVLRIFDDGRGFEPDDPGPEVHWGLAIMHDRAEMIGGHLELASRRGSGTRVELTVPRYSTVPSASDAALPEWIEGREVSTPEGLRDA